MKILLVDDSKSARYALRLELQRHGAEVATADSAEAAFEQLKGELPDAVLMDHTMPGLNGIEALAVIRADPRTAQLPVIICSSNEDQDFAATARARGANGILPKSTAAENLPMLLARLGGAAGAPAAVAAPPPASPFGLPAATAPAAGPTPPSHDLTRLIDERVSALVEDRIEARLSRLLEPLLGDLERGLAERLTALTRQLVEAEGAGVRAALEQRLAAAHDAATKALDERLAAGLESGVAAAVGTRLPPLLHEEIETERAQVLSLVEQYLREVAAREAAATHGLDARIGELDGVIAAKAREIVRREVAGSTDEVIERTRQTGEEMIGQLRSSLTMIYLSILGAALIGILAAAAVYFLPH